MGMGTAGVPRGAGCWGQVGCPGGASPSHPHPSGPGRGYSSAPKHRLAVTLWQTAPRRWLHGRGPRAPCRQVVASSCDTSDTTMPMQIPLPSLAAASNGQRWGRGPRHPLSLPFSAFWGGCVLWQHRVSLWSWHIPRRRSGQPPAWQGGDLPTRRVRDNACVPAWCPPARPCPRDAEGVGASEAAHGNILPVPVSLPPRCSCLTRARPALAVGRCRSCPPLKPHWMRPRMRWHGEAPSCHCQHWGRSPLGPVRCQARDGHRQEQSHMPGKSQKPLGRDWKGHGATPATGSCSGVRGAAVWLGSGWDLPVPPRPNHRHVLEPRLLGRGSRSPPTWDVATGLALGAHGPSLGRGTGTAGLWLAAGASRPARRGEWQRFGAGKDGMCLGWALLQFLRASNKGVTKAGGTPPAPGIVPLRRGSGSRGGVQSGAEPRLGGVQPPRLPPALGEPWSTPNPQPITPKAPAGPRGGGYRQVALKKKGWGRPGYWDQSALGTGPTAPNSGWHWGQCPGLTGPPGGSWAGRGWQPRQYIIIIYPVYWSCA